MQLFKIDYNKKALLSKKGFFIFVWFPYLGQIKVLRFKQLVRKQLTLSKTANMNT